MSNDKNKNAKLLALGYMTVVKSEKLKRKTTPIVTISAMETHAQERYDDLLALKARLNAVKEKCAERKMRFSTTAWATQVIKEALVDLEKAIN